ncbi:4-(cytidine 5'-diphospho)-2-C-methyl-D-erythritol kinase [Pelagibius marinus]|uniref:4-(cytidine 5'-diphospho)-2-C-methyl-D-erythritol kinase n=1 Tax=Pelagibius marinus TaxID=2762760 RepID=UPI0029CA16D7|nr:4-(cytidine 5'-diphospho)-2-C-methyl-D-erythritol kinase [Pelagibius marinus]
MTARDATALPETSEATLFEDAWAKINLTLQITGRRPDGYHELNSLVVFAQVGDKLSVAPAVDAVTLQVEGPFADGLRAEPDNLVLRAARALAAEAAVDSAQRGGAVLTLTKNLPVASGIGGGSADAAAALRGLARLWDVGLAPDRLEALALRLGADVPVCLRGVPVVMSGIGERLEPVPALPPLWFVLVNPRVAVSTAAVFAGREGTFSQAAEPLLPPLGLAALIDWLAARPNDLQAAACRQAPAVVEVLAALEGLSDCLLARMSGSGATCFGLFESEEAALYAAEALALQHSDWWVAPALLRA